MKIAYKLCTSNLFNPDHHSRTHRSERSGPSRPGRSPRGRRGPLGVRRQQLGLNLQRHSFTPVRTSPKLLAPKLLCIVYE